MTSRPVLIRPGVAATAMLVALLFGCASPSGQAPSSARKAVVRGTISGAAVAALVTALGGSGETALAAGVGTGMAVGALVYIRNEKAIAAGQARAAEALVAQYQKENASLRHELYAVNVSGHDVVLIDGRQGAALEVEAKLATTGERVKRPLGVELNKLPDKDAMINLGFTHPSTGEMAQVPVRYVGSVSG